ncbi:MAG: thiamine pyrophosphate-dependent dehydrogenase E1 component subunit alpha, partial [Alphaproteobacteria bacterium]
MADSTDSRRNLDIERFTRHFETMARIRAVEETALAAAKEGLVLGAIHPSIGQEAVAAGVCGNLGRADILLS